MGNPKLLTAAAACAALVGLGGCAGTFSSLKEIGKVEQVHFDPVYASKFGSRSSAEPTTRSAAQLERRDYVHLGDLSVKYVDKRCFPDVGCNEKSHSDAPTARLLAEAAKDGGDLVILARDNTPGKGTAQKYGRCLREKMEMVPRNVCDYETICNSVGCYNRQTTCHTEYVSQTVCAEREKINGDEYYRKSDGSVWRHDPALKLQVRYGDEFIAAVRAGRLRRVEALARKGIRADVYDLRGRYPLLVAVKANRTGVARFLISKGAHADIENSKGLTTACTNGDAAMVSLLLDHGADPNAKIGFWKALTTTKKKKTKSGEPLIHAVDRDDLVIVRMLLDHGADPNAQDGKPLKEALGDRRMVELLLAKGASVNENGVLTAAVQKHDAGLVEMFLAKDADPDNREWSGETPLQTAAENGDVDIMRVLLAHGADVDRRGVLGIETPLMYAADYGHVEAVKLLLEHKADVTYVNFPNGTAWLESLYGFKGRTALSMARIDAKNATDPKRKRDYTEIVDMLVAAGAKK